MANGLSKLIKRARKANESNILAKLARTRFRVEELEDRIAPAVVAAGGAADNGDHTFTMNADGEYLQFTDAGGETWELGMLKTGGATGDIVVTFDAAETTITGIEFGTTAVLDGTAVKLVIGDDGGDAAADLSLGAITDGQTNTASAISIYGINDTDFTNGITDGGADATTSALIDVTSITLDSSNIAVVDVETISGATVLNNLATTFTARGSMGSLTVNSSLAGAVSSTGAIGTVTLLAGTGGSGHVTAGTDMGAVTLGDGGDDGTLTFAGDIIATTGDIASITGTDETSITISGDITAGGTVGTIGTQIQTISGTITGASVGNITVLTDLADVVSTGTTIGNINVGNDLSDLTANTSIGTITVGNDITGTIGATTSIGNIDVTNDVSGTITAGSTIGNVTVGNDVTAAITGATTVGTVSIGNDLAALLKATASTIGAIDITGDVTAAGSIVAGSLPSAIDIGGDLNGAVTSSAGIADLNITGAIDAAITASAGALDVAAGSIAATAGRTISASTDATITLVGGIDSNGGDIIALTATAGDLTVVVGNEVDTTGNDTVNLTAGDALAFSTTSETVSFNYVLNNVTAAGDITIGNIDGNLTVAILDTSAGSIGNIATGGNLTIGTRIEAEVNIGNITTTGSGNITIGAITATTGTIGNIDAAGDYAATTMTSAAGVGTITSGGTVDLGTINVTAGGVGAITADTTLDATAITVSAGNLGAISAGGAVSVTGNVLVSTGNIGAITTTTGSITIGGDWTATAGSIGAITASDSVTPANIIIADTKKIEAGTTIGAISATGTVSVADAGDGATTTATIVAGAQAVDSGTIMSITDNGVLYTIASDNADAADTFDITITLTETDTDGTGAVVSTELDNVASIAVTRAGTGDLNLSLTTVAAADSSVNATEFDLAASGLTVASGAKTFGVITVEGDTAGVLNLGTGSSATAILVQDQIGGTISVDSLDVLAGANVVDSATADNLTASSTTPGADPNATAAAGTFTLPVASGADNEIVSAKADGKFSSDGTSNLQMIAITGDATLVGSVTYAAGVMTDVSGGDVAITGDITTATDLSSINGAINITGDVTGALTFGTGASLAVAIIGDVTGAVTLGDSAASLAITGDVSGAVTVGDLTGVLTLNGDVSGAVTAGDVGGNVAIADGNDLTADVTIGDAGGTVDFGALGAVTVTVGDVTGLMTADSVAVGGTIVAGDFTAGLTISGDMLGTLTLGDLAGQTLLISGDFGSAISIDGDLATLTLNDLDGDDIIGSATSTITATGFITTIDIDEGSDADATTYMSFYADITVGDGALTIGDVGGGGETLAYFGTFNLGATDGSGDFGVDTDGSGGVLGATEYAVNVNANASGAYFGTATYDATDGQTFTFTNLVLVDGGAAPTADIYGNVSGNIYIGNTTDIAITIDGDLTGSVIVDDDADVSALGLTATGTVVDTFDDGVAVVDTAGAFGVTADSIGGVTVEGDLVFDIISATDTTAGSIGDITAGGLIDEDGDGAADITTAAGNVGTITSGGAIDADINVVAGNLGLLFAAGNITSDLFVDEGYTFTGIVNTNGSYIGNFNVEATVSMAFVTGSFVDGILGNDFDTDVFGMTNITDVTGGANNDFAIEGYQSVNATDITVVGATTIVMYNNGANAMTIQNLIAGSSVTVDETDANVVDDIDVDGDMVGDITITMGGVDSLSVGGNLAGIFTAVGDIDSGNLGNSGTADLLVEGNWTGSVVLSNASIYDNTTPSVDAIEVWGDVSTATLSGATFLTAVDFNNQAIDDTATDEVASKTVYLVPNSDQYIYLTGGSVTADIATLFGQVTGITLEGKGGVQIITFESDTLPTPQDMMKAAKYGKKMIRGNETANDYIDFDMPGDANLPAINVGPAVQINSLVVDGDLGGLTDVDSNVKNVFVSGTAGDIFAGKNLINGYFGAAADIMAVRVNNLHVEGNATDIVGEKLTNIDIEGAVNTLASDTISNATVGGNVANLMAAKINRTYTAGTVANLHVQRDFRNRPGVISNSVLFDVTAHNIDFNATVGSGGATDVIVDNPDYNPVRIINSFVEL